MSEPIVMRRTRQREQLILALLQQPGEKRQRRRNIDRNSLADFQDTGV